MAATIVKPTGASAIQKAYIAQATTSASGSFEAGYFTAGFLNTGATTVTVNGQIIPIGGARTFPYVGKQYGEAVTYDATGGTLEITVIW